ncbi:MAG TPA: tRNA lysidine(34) synthetase TilS [Candidatus Brevibacterium intestinigallinarum]|nr:tRNA lysidine(34) synthetase TilS [Candidatus Brevibacterium intestinigallinarum]
MSEAGAVPEAGAGLEGDGPFLVAVSGGADSLALAAAAAFLHARGEARFLAVTVDHGLQAGSGDVARQTVDALVARGLPARTIAAQIAVDQPGGLEAAAREARYAALATAAREAGATTVLTGHTRNDQAETVLLGLLRGSGARSLAGMSPRTRLDTAAGPLTVLRPLLGLTRVQTRDSARAQGLTIWDDPMNTDPRFARVRARTVLRELEDSLGQDLGAGLARTADLLREDADHLDAEARVAWEQIRARVPAEEGEPAWGGTPASGLAGDVAGDGMPDGGDDEVPASLPLSPLLALAPAVRSRVLRTWLLGRGVPASQLTADHVRDVREVAAASGAGKREASVPGAGTVRREGGRLVHRRAD